ncbi:MULTISPECIES: enoyl-CoA hydratase/isomerase family protein [unclassified Chelatococcus]|uniref:enoyl-CoA hydratase/isomerase family protein n=1 Tax=unclassified Chelatococcus TaxID=2638111 RepID=UPI001BCA8ED1|nr:MULTISPECIES: enoyl-CoA hydratase/isomerase family protein [unclassified Chelatococcus]MBS7701393.1 enoyl-CoA hydratase/isomerase family protein [Chelatococcus sp. YT9]MBX3557473.1 enoyl-CoA hydratase/isomerase family protein [Chelatococcus sp.]
MSDLLISRAGYVQVAEINRPPHNYFDKELLALIADALDVADADKDVRVTLLCANGKSFCAGANFTGNQPETPEERRADSRQLYDQGLRIFRGKKPIVAAVQGHAIGGGLGVALAADFRVATPETSFSANFTRLGFHPGFGLTVTLPELVGNTTASLLMLTGRRVKGEEAFRIGLCDVLAPAESLRDEAMKLAQEIAESSPLGVKSTRETLRLGLADRVEERLKRELDEQSWLRETEDFAEGVRATAERRPAQFQAR